MSRDLESLRRNIRLAYSDIIRGYSYSSLYGCYIKHFNDQDLAILSEKDIEFQEEAKAKGLPTEQQKIKQLIKHGSWSLEDEGRINSLKKYLSNDRQLSKGLYGLEKEGTEKKIDKNQDELDKLLYKRSELIGLSSEKYIDKLHSDFSIYYSFYEDRDQTKKIWTEEEWEELSRETLFDFVREYNKTISLLTHENIQRIGAQPYFLNKVFISDGNPMVFFGKPAIQLTQFQSELMSQGRMYKNVLENAEKGGSPPESYYEDPDKLVGWYYGQLKQKNPISSSSSLANKSDSSDGLTAKSIVGASKEEMMAMASAKGEVPVDLDSEIQKKMKEKGKTQLNMMDMLQIHGEDTSMIGGGK